VIIPNAEGRKYRPLPQSIEGDPRSMDQELMVRTTLNTVSKDWVVFVQSILGRVTLLDWEEMWAALRQEEIKRLSKAGSDGKGI